MRPNPTRSKEYISWRCSIDYEKPPAEDSHGFLTPQVFYYGVLWHCAECACFSQPLRLCGVLHKHNTRDEATTCMRSSMDSSVA